MKLGIMQPYFFPYIGYFQLMSAVDEFIVYDNIEFSRKGWINRNRILVNDTDAYITLPLKNDSDYLNIVERSLTDSWSIERKKMLNRIKESYRTAPQFKVVFPIVEEALLFEETNLFRFLFNILQYTKAYLDISTPLVISSSLAIDHKLKSEDKVLAMVQSRKADVYINPIGGVELYSKKRFKDYGIDLYFLKSESITYEQNAKKFVPFLSILDVMMFNTRERISEHLLKYTLV
jgi:hypothetical protein